MPRTTISLAGPGPETAAATARGKAAPAPLAVAHRAAVARQQSLAIRFETGEARPIDEWRQLEMGEIGRLPRPGLDHAARHNAGVTPLAHRPFDLRGR